MNVDWAAMPGIVNHVREKEREVYFTEMEFESHSGKPKGRVEKVSSNEGSEDTHTVLRGTGPKDSVSIQGTSQGDSFSCP